MGELVVLKEGEEAPADLLVLNSNARRFTVIRKSEAREKVVSRPAITKLEVPKLGKFLLRLRGLFEGTINFEYDPAAPDDFAGFVRLKRDPQGEAVTADSLILRGDRVAMSNWVVGIIISAGNDCH